MLLSCSEITGIENKFNSLQGFTSPPPSTAMLNVPRHLLLLSSAQTLVFLPFTWPTPLQSLGLITLHVSFRTLTSGATSSWKPSQTSLSVKSVNYNLPPLWALVPFHHSPCHPVDLSEHSSTWTVNTWIPVSFSHKTKGWQSIVHRPSLTTACF